ncbi:CAP domain-containing protein [Plantactinospora veratri]|uniref:CAP domain-containing protein n=1 Tax=Plantactinospora veratri TaxID=1436122 RepID=A0ABU7SA70_9ACTN
MQGWNEQTDWEDGGDWPGRPDNGAAYPAVRAGHPDDRSRSSWHPTGAGRIDEPDEQHGDARWADEPDDLPPSTAAGWSEEPARDTGWSEEPARGPDPGEAGWVDGVTERWRRAGLDRVDEPTGRRQQAAARWADEPADLGAFELGRNARAVPDRRVRSGDHQPGGGLSDRGNADRDDSDRGSSGRHRRPTPLRGPIGLGVAVTALLGVFGVGAALLPPSLADAPAGNRGGQPAVEAAGPEETADPGTPDPTGTAEQTAAPEPTATATRPAPKPRATTTKPKPSRTTSPAARRTPARSGSGAGAAGSSQEAQVLAIVNQERSANGCGAVVINSDLAEAARLHSQDQGEHTNMSHTGSDGSDFVERARRAGYDRPIGENVAMGYQTAAAVMDGWMNSSGHRANILNCDAKAMGVGVATGADGRLYWTQVFGAVA